MHLKLKERKQTDRYKEDLYGYQKGQPSNGPLSQLYIIDILIC